MQHSCRRHSDYVSVNFLSRVVSAGVSLFVFGIYHPDFDMIQDMSSATALPKMTSPERCRATSSAPEVECSSTREQSRALPCSLRVRITPATHVPDQINVRIAKSGRIRK